MLTFLLLFRATYENCQIPGTLPLHARTGHFISIFLRIWVYTQNLVSDSHGLKETIHEVMTLETWLLRNEQTKNHF